MKNKMKITVSKKPAKDSALSLRCIPIRERILKKLFGDTQRIIILVPGMKVDEICISTDGPDGPEGH